MVGVGIRCLVLWILTCSSVLGQEFNESESNNLTVTTTADPDVQHDLNLDDVCSGENVTEIILDSNLTFIYNPGYPNSSCPRPCHMKYLVDAGCHTILFKLLNLDMVESEHCSVDSLTIYDNNGKSRGRGMIGRVCGNKTVKLIGQTMGGYLYLEFITANLTNLEKNHSGFRISVERTSMTKIEMKANGVARIMNPGYEQHFYSRPCSYAWLVTTLPGYVIEYHFQNISIYYSLACKEDSLTLYNADSSLKDEIITQVCGLSSTIWGKTSDRYLYLEFRASEKQIMDPSIFPGFVLDVKSVAKTQDRVKSVLTIALITVSVICVLLLLVVFACGVQFGVERRRRGDEYRHVAQ